MNQVEVLNSISSVADVLSKEALDSKTENLAGLMYALNLLQSELK